MGGVALLTRQRTPPRVIRKSCRNLFQESCYLQYQEANIRERTSKQVKKWWLDT